MHLIVPALDLHGQPEYLQEQHAHENDQVAIAAEYGFHNVSFQVRVSGFAEKQINRYPAFKSTACPSLDHTKLET